MLVSWMLSLILAVVTADTDPVQIENKNININVNINAKEIAQELWKVIESHLKDDEKSITRRLIQEDAVNELEEVIRRVVEPTRRLNPIAEIELAKNYERIVRRAIPTFGWDQSSPDSHANVDEVVDDMMLATKTLITKPPKISSSEDEPVKGQLLGTDRGEAAWSSILRGIEKSIRNIENTLQSLKSQIKRPSKYYGRQKNENFNKNNNFFKRFMPITEDQSLNDDDESSDDYRNDPSNSADLVGKRLRIPYTAADKPSKKKQAYGISDFQLMVQNGMQDVIPKRERISPSTVANLQNYLDDENNFFRFKKRPDNRTPAKYTNLNSLKKGLGYESKNKNINQNTNIFSFKEKNGRNDRLKRVMMPGDDNEYEDRI